MTIYTSTILPLRNALLIRRLQPASAVGFVAVALALALAPCSGARASVRMETGAEMLAPLAYSQFCMRYPDQCTLPSPPREHEIALTPATRRELDTVNGRVNSAIKPHRDTRYEPIESWLIYPEDGSCHDYAVTKRFELYARGWPAKSLLLAEVQVIATGEHHLVLVARTQGGDLVLDNLRPNVRFWSETLSEFRWLRIQSDTNPKIWRQVRTARLGRL